MMIAQPSILLQQLDEHAWLHKTARALLVAPAVLWVCVGCFHLWPWRGEETGDRRTGTGNGRAGRRGRRGDTVAAGQARFVCNVIGVAMGTTFMLILSGDRVSGVFQ